MTEAMKQTSTTEPLMWEMLCLSDSSGFGNVVGIEGHILGHNRPLISKVWLKVFFLAVVCKFHMYVYIQYFGIQ